jgi:hypothetical protein
MLYSEIIAVCSQMHTKHINTLCGQNVEYASVILGTYSGHRFKIQFVQNWTVFISMALWMHTATDQVLLCTVPKRFQPTWSLYALNASTQQNRNGRRSVGH